MSLSSVRRIASRSTAWAGTERPPPRSWESGWRRSTADCARWATSPNATNRGSSTRRLRDDAIPSVGAERRSVGTERVRAYRQGTRHDCSARVCAHTFHSYATRAITVRSVCAGKDTARARAMQRGTTSLNLRARNACRACDILILRVATPISRLEHVDIACGTEVVVRTLRHARRAGPLHFAHASVGGVRDPFHVKEVRAATIAGRCTFVENDAPEETGPRPTLPRTVTSSTRRPGPIPLESSPHTAV